MIAQLEAHGLVTPARREYLEGMLTPKEARAKKFPAEPDERALEVVALLSSEKAKVKRAVRAGLLELSPNGSSVRKEHRAQIAVELALRPVRALSTPAAMKGARAALQSAYLNREVWGKDLGYDGLTIEERRDAALEELDGGHPGPHCYRLAAQGAYWLAVQRILREARFFASEAVRDSRQPQRLVDELVGPAWGVHTSATRRLLTDETVSRSRASNETAVARRPSPAVFFLFRPRRCGPTSRRRQGRRPASPAGRQRAGASDPEAAVSTRRLPEGARAVGARA